MLDCKPVDTPMNPNVKLVLGQGEPLRDPMRYRRLIRRLNYLTITRPDISFPMSVVSRSLQSPCDSHWDVFSLSSVMSKEHRVRGCSMKTEITLKLLDIVMQTGQAHPQTEAPLQDIVYLLKVT